MEWGWIRLIDSVGDGKRDTGLTGKRRNTSLATNTEERRSSFDYNTNLVLCPDTSPPRMLTNFKHQNASENKPTAMIKPRVAVVACSTQQGCRTMVFSVEIQIVLPVLCNLMRKVPLVLYSSNAAENCNPAANSCGILHILLALCFGTA